VKRERLQLATKRAHSANPGISWREARRLGLVWCSKMWWLDFEDPRDPATTKAGVW
jgi:hypothetical protein